MNSLRVNAFGAVGAVWATSFLSHRKSILGWSLMKKKKKKHRQKRHSKLTMHFLLNFIRLQFGKKKRGKNLTAQNEFYKMI